MTAPNPIRDFRKRQIPRMSQEAFAKKIGVDRVTVARWESGNNKPHRDLLPKLVRVTRIPACELRPDLAAEAAALFSGGVE